MLRPEIQAAHRRLSLELVSGKLDLSREDIDSRLQEIDFAFYTLSAKESRDAYDAQLVTNASANVPVPLEADALSLRSDPMSLRIADAIKDNHRLAVAIADSDKSPLKVTATVVTSFASPFKKVLAIIGSLMAMGVVIQVVSAALANYQTEYANSKLEEKVYLQEYYEKHGVRVGSRAEADLLDRENRRTENAQNQAALDKQKQDEEYRRFVEESDRMGERVSNDIRLAEDRAHREEEQKKREFEREFERDRLNQEEAERNRIEEERRRLGLNEPQSPGE